MMDQSKEVPTRGRLHLADMSRTLQRTRSIRLFPGLRVSRTLACLANAFLLLDHALLAVTPCEDLHGKPLEDLTLLDAQPEFVQAIDKLVNTLNDPSLVPEIGVHVANVENAVAVLCTEEPRRRILYSANYFGRHSGGNVSEWLVLAILAHEIGHHVENHPLLWQHKNREDLELSADEFTGAAICKLGGELKDAQEGLGYLRGRSAPDYPATGVREEKIALAFDLTKKAGLCPPPPPSPRCFRELPRDVRVKSSASLEDEQRIVGTTITFAEDVEAEVDHALILFARTIVFEGGSSLHGPDVTLIAEEIQGGTVSADGAEEEPGGRILVVADRIAGTTLTARGGNGKDGEHGENGKNGKNGYHGRDAQCELDSSRAAESGENGKKGLDGKEGQPGTNGGDGGTILLVARDKKWVLTQVDGGFAGHGGHGGKGGHGGFPGHGGEGCESSYVQHSQGENGEPGAKGDDVADGSSGKPGQKGDSESPWKLKSAGEICQLVKEGGHDLSSISAEAARRRSSATPAAEPKQ